MTSDRLLHRDGIAWEDAPTPRRFHFCTPQTVAFLADPRERVERCACGAIRLDGDGPWLEKNSRRRAPSPDAT